MTMNRAQRRALRGKTGVGPAKLARHCYDIRGDEVVRITDPHAVSALARAFTLLEAAGGMPVAIQLSHEEAAGFPHYRQDVPLQGPTWLAVGLDQDRRGTYAMQTAASANEEFASEAARALAYARLAENCATRGFPIGKPKGQA